ncbi:MAG TPA: TIGR03013 family XrtA/PEP-CTERM system glycosyltransferase [Steroidobacteraceae bacterium]|jgi:sugar transferase (PEP-CTERM system associated)|nr:TIGR03013 family XrtA/PEP-CTERM system glycosyltransferase [Steroidobacteraceae bacterium]
MRLRFLGQFLHMPLAVLAALEGLLFVVMLFLAAMLRLGTLTPTTFEGSQSGLWVCAAVFSLGTLIALASLGLYSPRQRSDLPGLIVRLAVAVVASFVLVSALFYEVPTFRVGRGILALSAFFTFCAVLVTRGFLSQVVDEGAFRRRILVFGAGQRALAIASLRRRADRRGFTVAGYVQAQDEVIAAPERQILKVNPGLRELCEEHEINEIVVAMEDRRRGFPIAEFLECRFAGIDVTELLTFLERETGRVAIDVLNPSWLIFGEGFRRNPLRLLTARSLDLLASAMILLVFLPVMLLTALAIKLEEGWNAPILYRQARIGMGGVVFDMLKFRSMRTDAESSGEAQWAQASDARVTRVGAMIRKLRVDELPQIFNVVRGDMSFVGPRPERPEFVAQLSERIPYYVERHCVKPGITGWAQLCYPYGSSERDALEKLQYDLYYIKNNSLLFDLAIIVQTVEVVLMGKGAR